MFSAIEEIARVKHEFQKRLSEERSQRLEAEKALEALQDKWEEKEQEIRGELCDVMEEEIEKERKIWKWARAEDAVRNEEHLAKKLEIVARSISDFKRVNEALRRKIVSLERELKENVKVQSEVDKRDTAGVWDGVLTENAHIK
ncbi:MAG: hypothetical protein M1816_005662 [Peltula sp. TS41687]|nr:MAG: hypothetical protein M1816_005662 [Peltula sp. TS41687]